MEPPITVELNTGVALSPHSEEGSYVHVDDRGTIKVDRTTFDFLHALVEAPGRAILIPRNPQNQASVHLLRRAGVVSTKDDSTDDSQAVAYRGEIADLVVRRDLKALTAVLNGIARPIAQVWNPFVVYGGCLLLLVDIGYALATTTFGSATRAWISQPILAMSLSFIVTLGAASLHEAGHIAAARFQGCYPIRCGIGFYIHRPTFYADVTRMDTYPRASQIHVDLAGLAMDGYVILAMLLVRSLVLQRSGLFDAILLATIVATIAPLNPLTKSDLNWFIRDAAGARGLPTSWGRPRQLVSAARNADALSERKYARALLLSVLIAIVLWSLAVGHASREILRTIRATLNSPHALIPIAVVWVVTIIGFGMTARVIRGKKP